MMYIGAVYIYCLLSCGSLIPAANVPGPPINPWSEIQIPALQNTAPHARHIASYHTITRSQITPTQQTPQHTGSHRTQNVRYRPQTIEYHRFAIYKGEIDTSLVPDCDAHMILPDLNQLRQSLDGKQEDLIKETYIAVQHANIVGFIQCERQTPKIDRVIADRWRKSTYEITVLWVHQNYREMSTGSNLLNIAKHDLQRRLGINYALCQLPFSHIFWHKVSVEFFMHHHFEHIGALTMLARFNDLAQPAFDLDGNFLLGHLQS